MNWFHRGIISNYLKSCKLASNRYREDLEKKKKSDQKIEISRKRKILNNELVAVKILDEEILMKKIKGDADEFIEQAAQDGVVVEDLLWDCWL